MQDETEKLDDEQKIILNQFRENLQDALKPAHDDRFLLRWLRARNFHLKNAEKMLRADLKLRKKYDENFHLTYKIREGLEAHELSAFLGFDKEGHSVRLFNAGATDFKGLSRSMTVTDVIEYYIAVLDGDLERLKENSKKTEKWVDTIVYIYDYTDFKISHFTDHLVIKLGRVFLKFYQEHYPETLRSIYMINAPKLFVYVFSAFKPFIDENVLKKIRIYGTDGWQDDIFSKISKDIIPAYLGGNREEPKGDPHCHDLLCWNPVIPKHLYLEDTCSMHVGEPGVREKNMKARSVFRLEETVTEPNMLLCWQFQTKSNNIHFGVHFKGHSTFRTVKDSDAEEVLLPVESVDCCDLVEQGEVACEKFGTYILIFDNSYSWLTSKHLLYRVSTHPGKEDADRISICKEEGPE